VNIIKKTKENPNAAAIIESHQPKRYTIILDEIEGVTVKDENKKLIMFYSPAVAQEYDFSEIVQTLYDNMMGLEIVRDPPALEEEYPESGDEEI